MTIQAQHSALYRINKITRYSLAIVGIVLSSVVVTTTNPALANPTPEALALYNQAVSGDGSKVDEAYKQLSDNLNQQGATPLNLVYLGSTQALQGRDAFLPWNKMKFTEKGLATIDKALNLLGNLNTPLEQQDIVQGLPEAYLTRAMAAVTYSKLPDLFNHFERGYDLFLDLLSEPQFEQQHFAATAWIYHYAIQASLRANDLEQAKQWLQIMESKDPQHADTIAAKALITNT
ncbi:hypothetical protein [Photobacterium profundum]|uniref:Uncharacterized protein n=1 Tax=Photobacterium profundum (strain SS9) TaxID=298386 RepID=Q6LUF3_PHOPR|nr:hypothetical protein [Photobacterium profundum]CAG19072.1 hypothetical protein PBPRA0651 [Photobacterium profundum SS9]